MGKAWALLAKMAEQQAEASRRAMAQMDSNLVRLKERRAQMANLLDENRARLEQGTQSMAEVQLISSFMAKLASLQAAIDQEEHQLLAQREALKQHLMKAQLEARKMDALKERDEEKAQQEAAEAEQRQMDAVAIGLFNRRR